MNDPSSFERAFEAFRGEAEIAVPKLPGSVPGARETRLRDLLYESGLAPSVDDAGDLVVRFRRWTFTLRAPDDDPEWTAIFLALGPYEDADELRAIDANVVRINADVKCVQAAREGSIVTITLGLLTETEPSAQLLHRCFRILVSALGMLRS